jgi:hypothetical protein
MADRRRQTRELFGQTDVGALDAESISFAEAASMVDDPDGPHARVRTAATKAENRARRSKTRRGEASEGVGSFD